MALRPIMEKTWSENILFSALVELTYRCNLDCFFCYNDVGQVGKPLSRDQYAVFFEEMAQMQVMNLVLTGGEPLAHPDFFFLGARARELGFVVRIKSNGHALRGEMARRVREEVDPFLIEVSLHGARPETHERQTRIPGSFERLISNLREMADLGLRVKLASTLTAWNEDEIEEMFDLAEQLGLRLAMSSTLTPRDNGDMSPLDIAPSGWGVDRLYRLLDERSAENVEIEGCASTSSVKKNCGAGSSGIAVDPYGNVFPCVQWRRPLGNLHQVSIQEIWRQPSARLEEIRSLTTQAQEKKERLGDVGRAMSFCLGLSEEKTGDPLGIDPAAQANAERLVDFKRKKRKRVSLPVVT